MIEKELLEEYIKRFERKFNKPGKGYDVSFEYLDINISALELCKDSLATRMIKFACEGDEVENKQCFAAFISYGLSLAMMKLNGKAECITYQDGFRDEAILKRNIDEQLNLPTDENGNVDVAISNILEWCVNPGGNTDIVDEIWKQLVMQPLRIIQQTMLPRVTPKIIIAVPPVSKEIGFPNWQLLLSSLKMKNVDFSLVDYGTLFGVLNNERKYVLQYQTDGHREYLVVSAYELVRGKTSCIGSLAFDVFDYDKEHEMKTIDKVSFNVTGKKRGPETGPNPPPDVGLVDSNFNAGAGLNSFLGKHSVSFLGERYILKDKSLSEIRDIAKLYSAGEALQVAEVCAGLLGKENLYNISLEDMVAVTNRLERSKGTKKAGVTTGHVAKLGTYKGIDKNINTDLIRKIPSNYANITWRLKDKKHRTVPYGKLEFDKYSNEEIIESIIDYYETATTEVIAEDFLYIANNSLETDPSAYFAAKIFMLLLTMDTIAIDSRNEFVKHITNVDQKKYIPISIPSMPTKQAKQDKSKSSTSKQYVRFVDGNSILNREIECLKLSSRSYNSLKRAKINTVEDLVKRTPEEIMKIRNLGRNNFEAIVRKLKEEGLELSK